jgi:hypothetical protein
MPKPLDLTQIAIRGSTQEHLEIEDIQDNIVILKDGSCSIVIATTAINFGLLSEEEQEATIYAYAALLNSLSFPIQIVVRSQKENISNYLKLIDQKMTQVASPKIRIELQKYKKFISETVKKNEVLEKNFYLVVPMSILELGATKALTSSIARRKQLPLEKNYILERAKTNLFPKKDHILKQLGRLGIKGRQLTTPELIQLFFEIYNPETKNQQVSIGRQPPPTQAKFAPVSQPPHQLQTEVEVTSPQPVKPQAKPASSLQDEIDHLVEKASL